MPSSRKGKSGFAALPWLLGGAAVAALELGRRFYRQSQIFEPHRHPLRTWDPADYGIPPGVLEELWIDTPDGERLHAWYCRAPEEKASGVFCHGNTGNLTKSADVIPHLLKAGLSILFFDYRGFGKSSGRATYRGVIDDGVTAARFHDSIRPKHLPSILYGFSLGGAIAAQVIRRHRFDGLILQSTFTSLANLTRVMYPRAPMHLLAGGLFDTLRVIRTLDVPLLVMHGTADEVVPCSMSHEIFAACNTRKHLHIVENALHKDMYEREGDALVRSVSEFIAELA
jgi:alpha-beta hydrolase superfamily lysophospholipase